MDLKDEDDGEKESESGKIVSECPARMAYDLFEGVGEGALQDSEWP